jgi:anti-anti-sigma factor
LEVVVMSEAPNPVLEIGSALTAQPAVITIEGVVDTSTISRLHAEFARAADAASRRIVLDLSRLQLLDFAAISSILRGIRVLRSAGTELEIRYPSPMALQLFELCSLIQVVGIEFALDPHELSDAKTVGRPE